MFRWFKLTRAINRLCKIEGNANPIYLQEVLSDSAMDAASDRMKNRKISPEDAVTFAVTQQLNIALSVDPALMVAQGFSPEFHAENIAFLTRISRIAVADLVERGGDETMVVFPPAECS